MRLPEPAAAHPLFKPLAMLFILFSVFILAAVLLLRSFWYYDVAVASLDTSGKILQQLERLDVPYRVCKDGKVVVPNTEIDRLQRAAIPLDDLHSVSSWRYRLLLIGLLSVVGIALFFAGRRLVAVYRELFVRTPPEAEIVKDETPKPISQQRARPSQRSGYRLFEGEHPQTIAVYLLGLAAAEAADALETMPEARREAVWERMAFGGACDKGLQACVHALYVRKAEALRKRTRPGEVTEKMAAIFRRLPSMTQEKLLIALRREDEAFAALLEAETKEQVSTKEA